MRFIQAVVTLSLLVLALGSFDPCLQAYKHCDWEFSGFPGKIPVFRVNIKPDVPFTPQVVSKNPKVKIGVLNTNGVAPEFITDKGAIPITHFATPPFTETHFKPITIDYIMGSGVAHQTFHGNQAKVAWGKCVRLYFTTFQLLARAYPMPVVNNINVTPADNKCVVFRID